MPVGLGMGATQAVCMVMSPTLAAGILPMRTVAEAFMIIPGPPGIQPASMHGRVVSIIRAAGMPPMNTVG